MKHSYYTRHFFILMMLLVATTSFSQDKIIWSLRKLNWSDFKAKPDDELTICALTYPRFSKDYRLANDSTLEFKIAAWFLPEKSWVKMSCQTEYILTHEQVHFDLTELHARKMRKFISEYRFDSTYKIVIPQIFQAFFDALKEDMKRYDSETRHGGNKTRQREWTISVQREINELSAFDKTVMNASVKK